MLLKESQVRNLPAVAQAAAAALPAKKVASVADVQPMPRTPPNSHVPILVVAGVIVVIPPVLVAEPPPPAAVARIQRAPLRQVKVRAPRKNDIDGVG